MNLARLARRHVLAGAFASAWTGVMPKPATAAVIPLPVEDFEYIDWDSCMTVQDPHAPFQAEFSGWFGVAKERFARPVILFKDLSSTTLHVPGLHPALAIDLNDEGGINVHVTWRKTWWDILASFDVAAVASDGTGWRNVLLVPEAQVLRASQEACWVADGFEPLLCWFNEELSPATHLALLGAEEGDWTAVRLVQDGKFQRSGEAVDGCRLIRHLLPLHVAT